MKKFDGIFYADGENTPDFGTFKCVSVNGNQRRYEGESKDISKLPKYVGAGSSALCVDTGDLYKFNESTKTWSVL